MNAPELPSITHLMLNAGQLEFPGKESRAIALALACHTETQDRNGATGTGHLPDVETLIATAEEFVTVPLDLRITLHALDVLRAGRYLEVPFYDQGMPYRVNTATLPMRYTVDDCPDPNYYANGVESDLYGYGDH